MVIESTGVRTWIAASGGMNDRVLATLIFTDLVGSTEIASRLGDMRWRDRLETHYAALIVARYSSGDYWSADSCQAVTRRMPDSLLARVAAPSCTEVGAGLPGPSSCSRLRNIWHRSATGGRHPDRHPRRPTPPLGYNPRTTPIVRTARERVPGMPAQEPPIP
jgi:hypothetical protein